MAYYVVPQPAVPGGYAVPPPFIQPQLPDLEFMSMTESQAISQLLIERSAELRLEGLVHVFLPKKTPQRLQPDLELIEATLLTSIVNCTEDVLNAYNREFDWKTVFSMKEWKRLQLLMEHGTDIVFTAALSNALFNLRTGQKLPLYIRKQNCAIIFTKTSKSHSSFKIETFQTSMGSEEVMSHLGSLLLSYPHTVDWTENSQLLCSSTFLYQIRDLALNEYEASMPKIKKGGQELVENRDVAEPYLVTELLIGMLTNGEDPNAQKMMDKEEVKVTKKNRDNVEWNNGAEPFRRSGLWMAAKVNLQLCLLEEMGEKDAKMAYKMIMLRLISNLVKFRADISPDDWDLMHQMLAKLGRRALKISEMSSTNEMLMTLKQNILKDAYVTVETIQSKMNFLWNELTSAEDTITVIDRNILEFRQDLNHNVRLLDEYLKTPIVPIREEEHDGLKDIVPITRWKTIDQLLKADVNYSQRVIKSDRNLDDELVWLHDLENANISDAEGPSSLSVYQFLIKYVERATKRYSHSTYHREHDPVSFSRSVITMLSLYKKLDEIATEKYPLLLEYSAGVDTLIFRHLLAADGPKDLALIDSLEKYFRKRHADAQYNSIIYQSQINKTIFSVRYAKQNTAMMILREEILKDTDASIERKKDEIRRVKRECDYLEKQILGMEHNYDETTGQHRKECVRCTYTKTWNRKKLSVRIYERPLPKDPYLQYALVFELLIPTEISCVRDALALITKEVLGSEEGLTDHSKITTNWIHGYKPIMEYIRNGVRYPELVQIGSLAKPVSISHYKKSVDIFVATPEEFIVESGMNCLLFHVRKLKEYNSQTDPFSFQISTTSDEEKLYRNLQFCISGTDHTQNHVISEQQLLNSGSLPPSEFLSFCSLRSGHRLQLRNLYKFLSEKSLNIEREPVLANILQTVWSSGQIESQEGGYRSRTRQSEFCNEDFASEFLKLLGNVIKSNSHNWSSPLTLLTPVVILIQILKFTLSEDVRRRCAKLLKKCRAIIDGWVQTVQEQLSLVPTQDPIQKENEQLFLKARILEMLIAAAFTFHSGGTSSAPGNEISKNYLLQNNVDLELYLKILSGLHYYVNVEKIHEKLTPFMQILLQMARQRIPLNLESHVHQKIQHLGNDATLVQFSNSDWNKNAASSSSSSARVRSSTWRICGNYDKRHVYQGHIEYLDGRKHKIHVDIIGGALLIDSYPPTHLPSSISQNFLFQRYFGTQYGENFKVRRDATTFTTDNKINGRNYTFFQAWYQERLVIICRELLVMEEDDGEEDDQHGQKLDDNNFLELLDPEMFRGIVASPFVENYTHWLNPRTKEVYFRKRMITGATPTSPSQDIKMASQFESDYKMTRTSNGTWKFVNQIAGKFVVAISSKGYELLSEILARVEEWRYINILLNGAGDNDDSEELIVTASLPRLGLNFHLIDGLLQSVEYPDFYICLNQSKGTLVGLKNSLLLEKVTDAEIDGKKHLILLPHGIIGNDKQSNFHHITMIGNDDHLRQPPFFVYEVDHTLKRLKADKNKSAWLFLAALHGATTSCLPDPLTGLTGTEMAVWILQSGLVWSSSPYDFECKRTLQMIQTLSPVREYYPANKKYMEKVEWLLTFPSYAAFDGYEIIVQKLIQDSERLQELFPLKSKWTPVDIGLHSKSNDNQILRMRAYLRHLSMYNPCAHLNDNYLSSCTQLELEAHKKKETFRLIVRRNEVLSSLQEISLIRSNSKNNPNFCFSIPPQVELANFVLTTQPIQGSINWMEIIHETIRSWMTLDLKRDWLRIYNLALAADDHNLHNQLTLILCTMAYHQKEARTQLLNIHFISRFRRQGRSFPYPMGTDLPYVPANSNFSIQQIQKLLRNSAQPFTTESIPPSTQTGNDHREQQKIYNQYRINYKKAVEDEVIEVSSVIFQLTSHPSFGMPLLHQYFINYTNHSNGQTKLLPFNVVAEIYSLISDWMRNLQLKNFVVQIQRELEAIYGNIVKTDKYAKLETDVKAVNLLVTAQPENPLNLDLPTFFCSEKMSRRHVPRNVFQSGSLAVDLDNVGNVINFNEKRTVLSSMAEAIFEELAQSIISNDLVKYINICGLFPRLVPIHLFDKLVSKKATPSYPEEILDHIGGIAVLQTHVKRLNRLIKYEEEGPQMATEFERELENNGHENWSPKEFPEWLLLELDLDLMIRPIQVQVAQQMTTMPDKNNGVMQLNMGEGKTSLIVPMLVSTLANQETLCRVTVLNSIFKTNLDLLSNAIGGLLNRRVYQVPCRRDAKIKDCLGRIWEVYKECLDSKGAVLTLAEYRLSPRLMAYEKLLGNKEESVTFGLDLLDLENWLRDHCRDILDESDELLSAKYQLIYTTGAQLSLGGGTMRWITCQNILNLVPEVLQKLWSNYGERVVEFDMEKYEDFPEQFPPCRLLSNEHQLEFYSLLVDQILGGGSALLDIILSEKDYEITKRFLTEPEISKDDHQAVLEIFKDDLERLERILLISGYLRRGILHLALSKRWRVEYGVDGKGRREMAVPFRAKDVAAERTEFGHPDVGIVLTHLSYYYSGLKDEQLMESFMVLKSSPGPEQIYQEWVMDIPKERLEPSIRSYDGVNLRDFKQRTVHLFPVLKKNKKVVDFWLSHKVFPKESKQFPRKIVTTAWDLCYERNKLPSTGFSGTNDSSILLPLPIKQQDLPQLQETNRQMEEILKLPENNRAVSLTMGVTCQEILQKLKKDGIRVLIDAGALMLELGNEQVAHLWLETDGGIEGVVYFNERNELLVKVRASNIVPSTGSGGSRRNRRKRSKFSAQDIPLEVSPYRERLDRCGIFLDDQHTRGTDLKFPNGFRGCVTVGSRMKRDKLIQAAMRMRKLGKGHSVSFYLSHEVSNKVQEQVKDEKEIVTEDILEWVRQNSEDFEKEGLIHWAMAGKNYAQKLAAEDMFNYTNLLYPTMSSGRRQKFASILGNQCVEEEMTDLMEMYGSHLKQENLIHLLSRWFGLRKQKLVDDKPLHSSVESVYDAISEAVVSKCSEHIPDKMYLANNFDEEQEKELELEPEHEEIRCIRRQKSLKPMEPGLHQDVKEFALSGRVTLAGGGNRGPPSSMTMVRLSEIFANTSFHPLIQADSWNCDILASQDFTRVVKCNTRKDRLDCYLRPISYIISLKKWKGNKRSTLLLLISPHEANELIGYFKTGKVHPDVKLHMFSTRCFVGQDILINNRNLQLPLASEPNLIEDKMIAPLLLASGSLFFGSMTEQRAYVRFLGFIPRPWTSPVEQEALNKGWILKTGFLLPKHARSYEHLIQEQQEIKKEEDKEDEVEDDTSEEEEASLVASDLNFEEDPSAMVKAILENRHISVRDSAHVTQLLSKCAFVELPDEEGGGKLPEDPGKKMEGTLCTIFQDGMKINDSD